MLGVREVPTRRIHHMCRAWQWRCLMTLNFERVGVRGGFFSALPGTRCELSFAQTMSKAYMYIQTVDNGVRGMDGGGATTCTACGVSEGGDGVRVWQCGWASRHTFFCGSDLHTRKNIHSYAAHPGHISRCTRAKLRRCPRRRTQSTAHTPGSLAHGGASAGGLSNCG